MAIHCARLLVLRGWVHSPRADLKQVDVKLITKLSGHEFEIRPAFMTAPPHLCGATGVAAGGA